MEQEPKSYMASHTCGNWVALVVDDPDYKNETAKSVAGFIRSGFTVSLVTTEDIRSGKYKVCKCPRPRKAK